MKIPSLKILTFSSYHCLLLPPALGQCILWNLEGFALLKQFVYESIRSLGTTLYTCHTYFTNRKKKAQTTSQRKLLKLFGKQMETHPISSHTFMCMLPVGPSLIVWVFSSLRPSVHHSKTFPAPPQVFALNLQWAVDS